MREICVCNEKDQVVFTFSGQNRNSSDKCLHSAALQHADDVLDWNTPDIQNTSAKGFPRWESLLYGFCLIMCMCCVSVYVCASQKGSRGRQRDTETPEIEQLHLLGPGLKPRRSHTGYYLTFLKWFNSSARPWGIGSSPCISTVTHTRTHTNICNWISPHAYWVILVSISVY